MGIGAFSEDFDRLLRYGRAVDIGRLEQEVGHRPRYTTVTALEDWVLRARENEESAQASR